MLGKAQVHRLKTDKPSALQFIPTGGVWRYYGHDGIPLTTFRGHQSYFLYFTTDEEIKDGDLVLTLSNNPNWPIKIWRKVWGGYETLSGEPCSFDPASAKDFRKVVATTNPDLWGWDDTNSSDGLPSMRYRVGKIDTDFIEAYVRAEGKITEVMLEYEYEERKVQTLSKYPEYIYTERPMLKLRNNGTVIIKPVKEKTYTHSEVEHIILKAFGDNITGWRPSDKVNLLAKAKEWFHKNYPQ